MVGGAVEVVEDRTLMRMVLWLCFDGDGTHCARHPSASSRPFEFWWGVKHCSFRPLTGQAIEIWGRRPDRKCASAVPALSGRARGFALKKVPETSPCWLCPLLHAPRPPRWGSLRYQREPWLERLKVRPTCVFVGCGRRPSSD